MLVLTTALVVVAVTVHTVRASLDRRADESVRRLVRSFSVGPARLVGDDAALSAAAREWLATTPIGRDEVAAVRVSDGTVLAGAGGISLRGVPGARAVLRSTSARSVRLASEAGGLRLTSVPLRRGDRHVGTLVVGVSEREVRNAVASLLGNVAMAGAAGVTAAAIAGFFAVRRALTPLTRMTREVSSITAGSDLSRRVGETGVQDEVGRLARSFDAMMQRLEGAFVSQHRFLADAAHELRTPLTVARGQAELALLASDDPEVRRSLATSLAELDRIGHTVEDLLLLARLEEGAQLHVEPTEVDLVLNEVALRAEVLGRATSVYAEPGLVAIADPERLLQAVTNLVTNAFRHAGEEAEVALTARPASGRVLIEVADNGVGIGADELPRVFDRLYRGSMARQRQDPGSGLGLAIVRSLITAMGGEVTVASEVGIGTTFTIALPSEVSEGSSQIRRSGLES